MFQRIINSIIHILTGKDQNQPGGDKEESNTHISDQPLPTIFQIRFDCPFYGFHGEPLLSIMADQRGNQCSLISGYSPCEMCKSGQTPNWEKCPLPVRKDDIIANFVEHQVQVFPLEFFPEDTYVWEGLTFEEWHNYIKGPRSTRPIAEIFPEGKTSP